VILCITRVNDRCFKLCFGIERLCKTALCPPVFSDAIKFQLLNINRLEQNRLSFFQSASAPGFQVVANARSRSAVGRDHGVNVVYSSVCDMQLPISVLTDLGNRTIDQRTFDGVQDKFRFRHLGSRPTF
jgi:hypothetical protein